MPIDMDDAMRSGAVSHRAAKKHGVGVKGPRAKPSEMTTPKRLDQGMLGNSGAVPVRSHNSARQFQHTGKGMPTKGGGVGSSYVPGRKAIDQFPEGQRRMDSAGAKMKGAPMKGVPNTRSKGPIRPSGGYYGGGGQGTQ